MIAFLRTLSQNNISNYFIIASSDKDSIFKTTYSSRIFAVRECRDLDMNEILSILSKAQKELGFQHFIIAPSTEYLNRFVLNNIQELKVQGLEDVLVEQGLYRRISDKKPFVDMCRAYGICVPEEIAFPENFKDKFVAKPKRYANEEKRIYAPVIVHNEMERQQFTEQYPIEDFYFQRYIEGRRIYLLYYVTRTGDCYKFSQEN